MVCSNGVLVRALSSRLWGSHYATEASLTVLNVAIKACQEPALANFKMTVIALMRVIMLITSNAGKADYDPSDANALSMAEEHVVDRFISRSQFTFKYFVVVFTGESGSRSMPHTMKMTQCSRAEWDGFLCVWGRSNPNNLCRNFSVTETHPSPEHPLT